MSYIHKIANWSISGKALLEMVESIFSEGKDFRFIATGFSMYPFIKHGDIITLSPINMANLRRGDVVAYINPKTGKLNIHRLIFYWKTSYWIKGDNTPGKADKVPEKDILGLVRKVERKDKRIHFGLGAERVIISIVSMLGFLPCLTSILSRSIRLYRKRFGTSGTSC